MYRKNLFLYFFVVFVAFTVAVTIVQYNRELTHKTDQLDARLKVYSEIVAGFIAHNNVHHTGRYYLLDSLYIAMDNENLRLTIVGLNGEILYDNVGIHHKMENHLMRPEIRQTFDQEYGTDIRLSASTGTPYYYLARRYPDFFVRTALDYDQDLRGFLRAEIVFFVILAFLFFIMTLLLIYISGKFGKTLSNLKDFAMKAARDEQIDPNLQFPKNELGIISKQIVNIYDNLKKTRDSITMEKEKLIRHLHISREGIAIFSEKKTRILANSLFIQNMNFIAEKPSLNPEHIFNMDAFNEVNSFVDHFLGEEVSFLQANLPSRSFFIEKKAKHFSVQVVIFSDKTFEVSLNDVTATEKEKTIKQQLTSNIAHELRTPVSSISAYLETIQNNQDLEPEKVEYFVSKAYKQAQRLSDLLRDISLLNKMEEAAVTVEFEDVSVNELVNEILDNHRMEIQARGVEVDNALNPNINIKANYSLVHSIFQNLLDNSLFHAGKDIRIILKNYEDENFYYFSFADTGTGIDEKHLGKIFDRFFRVDKGRSRKSGGTGLGLAIVKNAVLVHKGAISVKNREGGGLEFFFSLGKKPL
jgi:two-component system, OmpR family, phosphate regulon sensor histidine kinase PhoR